ALAAPWQHSRGCAPCAHRERASGGRGSAWCESRSDWPAFMCDRGGAQCIRARARREVSKHERAAE
ncbi:MAG: hypothetical protein ACK55I_18045, partial [bacterium]